MLFFKNTSNYISKSVSGVRNDINDISAIFDKKRKVKSNPRQTYKQCLILSAAMSMLLIINILSKNKDAFGIILFSILTLACIVMSVLMYLYMAKYGDEKILEEIEAEKEKRKRYEERKARKKQDQSE